ncbi:MAG: hypothetical protein IT352_03955 [Gemmatimonadales bacterium]|nr:hypothetical protein [Gemmatimonadales bacterium]
MWLETSIDVVGLPWCRGETRRIGIANLTAKFLCRHHNNSLSGADVAAVNAFAAIRRMTQLNNERAATAIKRRWKVRRFEVDGPCLERWFLKTAVNLALSGEDRRPTWHQWPSDGGAIPRAVAEMAFGRRAFVRPMGLYATAGIGELIHSTDAIEFAPLTSRASGGLTGFLFGFRGFRFLLWMVLDDLPEQIEMPTMVGPLLRSHVLYHLRYLRSRVAKKQSSYLDLLWPDQPASALVTLR